jgi:putative acetyltransferase
LSDIWLRASVMAHPFLGEARLREERRQIEEIYLPKAETFVASFEQRPVGFIGLLDNFIGGLFVDPDRARQGIGRTLVDYALTQKRELTLEVYAANEQACAFYRAIGGVEIGRRPIDDFGLPFELIRMRISR